MAEPEFDLIAIGGGFAGLTAAVKNHLVCFSNQLILFKKPTTGINSGNHISNRLGIEGL